MGNSSFYSLSEVLFRAQAGFTYRIAVDSYWAGGPGKVTLNLFEPQLPANDDFINRIVLTNAGFEVKGLNRFASREPGEPTPGICSLWWSWRPQHSGSAQLTLEDFDIPFQRSRVVSICTGNELTNLVLLTSMHAVDANNISFDVTAGTVPAPSDEVVSVGAGLTVVSAGLNSKYQVLYNVTHPQIALV
jgi:hypothetical protein